MLSSTFFSALPPLWHRQDEIRWTEKAATDFRSMLCQLHVHTLQTFTGLGCSFRTEPYTSEQGRLQPRQTPLCWAREKIVRGGTAGHVSNASSRLAPGCVLFLCPCALPAICNTFLQLPKHMV